MWRSTAGAKLARKNAGAAPNSGSNLSDVLVRYKENKVKENSRIWIWKNLNILWWLLAKGRKINYLIMHYNS